MTKPWPTLRLANVLTEKRRRVEVLPDGSYPIAGVYGFGRGILLRNAVQGADIAASHLYRIASGQIIYSRLKAFEGAFALVPPVADGRYVSNEFPTFDVDTNLALSEYVALVLCTPTTWDTLAERITGVGARRERLQVEEFLKFEISLPSLEEQRRIVACVQRVDTALTSARRLLMSARNFAYVLRETRLVDNGDWRSADAWRTVTLEEICDVTLGFTKGRKLAGPTQSLPYLRALNVQDGSIVLDEVAEIEACDADLAKYSLQADDILLLEGGNAEHVGRAWIWDGAIQPCLHQNSVIRARVRDEQACNPRFLAWALGASPAREFCFDEASATSNVAHLGLAGARSIPLPLPPYQEQSAIVEELDTARAQVMAAANKVHNYEQLRETLVNALVKGSQRLPTEEPFEPTLVAEGLIA